jgi:hypothetical protein
MRGRWPTGIDYIDKLDGADATKERLKVILETLTGETRVLEACATLAIRETRFHQLREAALRGALTALEPRPPGRPSRMTTSDAEQIRALQQRVVELEQALHEAQVREEIALVLPNLQRTAGNDAAVVVEEKKMRQPHVKVRKPR